jgi:hypothetical protein
MIVDTDRIRKETFRYLLFALFASFAYDTFWLLLSASAYNKDETASDGGIERSVRHFSLAMTVLSFFFRVSSSPHINILIVRGDICILEGLNRLLENH